MLIDETSMARFSTVAAHKIRVLAAVEIILSMATAGPIEDS